MQLIIFIFVFVCVFSLLENRAVILVAPNQYLRDRAQRFDEQIFVVLCDYLILVENTKQVPLTETRKK